MTEWIIIPTLKQKLFIKCNVKKDKKNPRKGKEEKKAIDIRACNFLSKTKRLLIL